MADYLIGVIDTAANDLAAARRALVVYRDDLTD
jgi:hypothetical protein